MKTKIVYVRPGDLVEIRLVDHDDFDTTASGWKAQTYPTRDVFVVNGPHELTTIMPITRVNRAGSPKPSPQRNLIGRWLPIDQADKTITDVQDFPEVGMTIRTSDRYWVRDDDGRVYEAAWSEGNNGRDYWWDFEGESPVDPVEFMPHPLDPRFAPAKEGKANA